MMEAFLIHMIYAGIGVMFGFMLAAALCAGGNADRHIEELHQQMVEDEWERLD